MSEAKEASARIQEQSEAEARIRSIVAPHLKRIVEGLLKDRKLMANEEVFRLQVEKQLQDGLGKDIKIHSLTTKITYNNDKKATLGVSAHVESGGVQVLASELFHELDRSAIKPQPVEDIALLVKNALAELPGPITEESVKAALEKVTKATKGSESKETTYRVVSTGKNYNNGEFTFAIEDRDSYRQVGDNFQTLQSTHEASITMSTN